MLVQYHECDAPRDYNIMDVSNHVTTLL